MDRSGHYGQINETGHRVNIERAFVDYAIQELFKKPSDIKLVSNRNLLKKFDSTVCESFQTKITRQFATEDLVMIYISRNLVLTGLIIRLRGMKNEIQLQITLKQINYIL